MNLEEILKLERIVFYDGDCGFCNTSVQLILKNRKVDFYFIPLQSEISHQIMAKFNVEIKMNTLYLLENGKLYKKSTAAIRVAKNLGKIYPVVYYIGMIVPRFIRDWIYDQVAKRRHKIRPGYCAMPLAEEKVFFLGQ
jgi:predicted DCC family thiol-disulfide oxidoreductase YuxK